MSRDYDANLIFGFFYPQSSEIMVLQEENSCLKECNNLQEYKTNHGHTVGTNNNH